MKKVKNYKKSLLKATVVLVVMAGLVFVTLPAGVHAADIQPGGLPDAKANTQTIKSIMKIAFGIIGAFALLNVVLSGFKYVTSAGEPQKTSEAKSGVIYSIVGLMVAITAEALVVFVIRGP